MIVLVGPSGPRSSCSTIMEHLIEQPRMEAHRHIDLNRPEILDLMTGAAIADPARTPEETRALEAIRAGGKLQARHCRESRWDIPGPRNGLTAIVCTLEAGPDGRTLGANLSRPVRYSSWTTRKYLWTDLPHEIPGVPTRDAFLDVNTLRLSIPEEEGPRAPVRLKPGGGPEGPEEEQGERAMFPTPIPPPEGMTLIRAALRSPRPSWRPWRSSWPHEILPHAGRRRHEPPG